MPANRISAWLAAAGLGLLLAGCGGQHPAPPPDAAAADAPPPDTAAQSAAPAQALSSLEAAQPIDRAPLADLKNRRWPGVKQQQRQQPAVHYHNGKLVEDDSPPVIEIVSEFQEPGKGDELVVPAYPGDLVYMSLQVQTEGQTPLKDVAVQVRSQLGNRYLLMADRTDQDGFLEFHMLAGPVGRDQVTVTAAGVQRSFVLHVTPPATNDWLGGLDLKGVTPWDLLMSAEVKLEREQVEARFPFPVQALKDKTIRLAGFMMPLGINEKQKHFLLSAVPPSCFFHPPGGPSSAVEVFSDRGIEMANDPIVLEGRFDLVERNAGGILYRLHDARLVSKGA